MGNASLRYELTQCNVFAYLTQGKFGRIEVLFR